VAVKFILDDALQTVPNAAKRFLREAVTASRIQSRHAVETYDYAIAPNGVPYITMELLKGESVKSRLERGGPLSIFEVSVLLDQVGQALDAAHALDIVHRDIKPENLYIDFDHRDGLQFKVLDFGNAKSLVSPVVSNVSSPGMLAGSPAYVSPDLLLDPDDLDGRADLWALGVTAFKCLTGELPFQGQNLMQTVQAILDGELRRPSRLRPGLDPACDAWFAAVFSELPPQRPQSGRDMAASFRAYMSVASLPVIRAPLTPIAPRAQPARRVIRWALVAAAALAATGIAFATYAQSL
jgi:serine/threonine-protein kinase